MTNTTSVMKMTALAAAIAVSGGCVSAKMNPNDEPAAAAPAPVKEVAEPVAAASTLVTSRVVENGDSLWHISSHDDIYNTPFNWPLIFKANQDQIKDADLIYPGQVLAIPRDMGQSAIDAAVAHAKNRGAWSVGPTEASDTAYLGG